MTAIIETAHLTMSYGSHRGVVELDLTVEEGESFLAQHGSPAAEAASRAQAVDDGR